MFTNLSAMKLKDFLKTLNKEQKKSFYVALDVTPGYLAQISGGHSKCPYLLALKIEKLSNGLISLKDLRPCLASGLNDAGYVRKFVHFSITAKDCTPQRDEGADHDG